MFEHVYAFNIVFKAICLRFLTIWGRVLEVLKSFWEGSGRVCSMIFRIIIENSDFVKNNVFPQENL